MRATYEAGVQKRQSKLETNVHSRANAHILKCYYLMSFDNKMIIDATRGTIARFVNHCCEPNCEMIKWTVNGEPRMALFAGSKGIMTGEELTYDYNFE